MQEAQVRSLDWEDSSGGGNSNPLQYSCQENPMDRGPWQAIVLGGLKELDTTEHLRLRHVSASSEGLSVLLTGHLICIV